MRERRLFGPVMSAAWLLAGLVPALAQTTQSQPGLQPADSQQAPGTGGASQSSPIPGPGVSTSPSGTGPSPGEPGFLTGLFSESRSNLLGDLYGLRTALGDYGISLGLQETSEAFGNIGGIRQAVAYNGLTTVSLGIDTGKAFGLEGGIFNVTGLQIHGRNISGENLLTLQNRSGIEAQRSTRLWEIWYQQALLDDRADVKVGQQSLDQEFITSQGAGLFINASMGWPLVPTLDLYGNGPAYPLASLGVRLRLQPLGNLTVLGGVFDDNPIGGPFFDDGQLRGAARSGTKFNTGTGALAIVGVQYSINQAPGADGAKATGLPGVYKIGLWYDTGQFFDQRYDTLGRSLADPGSDHVPHPRRNNYSAYGVFDQMLWRPDPDGPRAVSLFARAMNAPEDRNLASLAITTGVTLRAPLPGRDNDTLGIGYGLAKISPAATQLDQDLRQRLGAHPVRSSESFIEVTYQYQAAPWWLLQPDFQYVFMPAGGIPNPLDPTRRINNSAAFGLRTNVVF